MSDIICAKCGEPWDYYGLKGGGYVEPGEGERILRGDGCPSCDFGRDLERCRCGHQVEHMSSLLNSSEGDELATKI